MRLSTLKGEVLADGVLVQTVAGEQVTQRATFLQGRLPSRGNRRLHPAGPLPRVSDHLVQQGPTFPREVDLRIDGATAPADLAKGSLSRC
jgi:hypothetical protein